MPIVDCFFGTHQYVSAAFRYWDNTLRREPNDSALYPNLTVLQCLKTQLHRFCMLLWKTGTVEMRIWPNDHCPPHVTAVCRPDSWTARFVFSMLTDDVSLWDIKPKQNAPSYGVVCQLANDIHANGFSVGKAGGNTSSTIAACASTTCLWSANKVEKSHCSIKARPTSRTARSFPRQASMCPA